MQSPGELAATSLWYMQGLHIFPAAMTPLLEELHDVYLESHLPSIQLKTVLSPKKNTEQTESASDEDADDIEIK